MNQKIILSQSEYKELRELLNIVKDKTNTPGIKRLAMARFDWIIKQARLKKKESGSL